MVIAVFVKVRVEDPDLLFWLLVFVVGLCLPCSAARVGSAAVRLGGTDAAVGSGGGVISGSAEAAGSLLMPLAAGDWQLRFWPGHWACGGEDIFYTTAINL